CGGAPGGTVYSVNGRPRYSQEPANNVGAATPPQNGFPRHLARNLIALRSRIVRRSKSSLGPEFLKRAAPANRDRLLTVVPVVVGLDGRVPQVSQVHREPDGQEYLADALDI